MQNRIREARLSRGATQLWLAKQAGVSRQTLRSIEMGSPTTIDTAYRIAKALGVSVDDLFGQSVAQS